MPTAPDPSPEVGRRRRLRRMKVIATAILAVAAAVYALTFIPDGGAHGVSGYVRAAAEAAMIGGLADWFAVTALFRHPLGLPIPHTALIPARKDALGRALESFVGDNFLTADALRERIAAAGVARRAGTWLETPEHADRIAAEAGHVGAAAMRALQDASLHDVLALGLRERLGRESVAARVGAVLVPLVEAGGHEPAVDLVAGRIRRWLMESPDALLEVIEQCAPGWSPQFVDRLIARRIHAAALRIVAEIEADRAHPLRRRIDSLALRAARRLRDDPAVQARFDRRVRRAVEHPDTARSLGAILDAGREALADHLDRDGELVNRLSTAVRAAGTRLRTDEGWIEIVNGGAARAAQYVADNYRAELTRIISDTVDRWDGRDTARRIELLAGRDLQYIRINGAVVGALAGVAIHALSSPWV